jgi:hypothetical protein
LGSRVIGWPKHCQRPCTWTETEQKTCKLEIMQLLSITMYEHLVLIKTGCWNEHHQELT